MSKFTGKSDACDWFCMHNEPEKIVGIASVYLGDAKVQTNTAQDLIPYYTHLIASMAASKDSQIINLSKESFIDSEEKSYLSWRIRDVIKVARKAKKEKKNFDFEYFKSNYNDTIFTSPILWKKIISVINENSDLIKEHISNDWDRAENYITEWLIPRYFYNVHDSMHNRMREDFIKFGEENGYSVIKRVDTPDKYKRTEGIYHPVFTKMCFDVIEFHKMMEKYGGQD